MRVHRFVHRTHGIAQARQNKIDWNGNAEKTYAMHTLTLHTLLYYQFSYSIYTYNNICRALIETGPFEHEHPLIVLYGIVVYVVY